MSHFLSKGIFLTYFIAGITFGELFEPLRRGRVPWSHSHTLALLASILLLIWNIGMYVTSFRSTEDPEIGTRFDLPVIATMAYVVGISAMMFL